MKRFLINNSEFPNEPVKAKCIYCIHSKLYTNDVWYTVALMKLKAS